MKIQIPTTCPSCDYLLIMVGTQLFCKNLGCPSQLSQKIIHFAKTLGIKGFGPKTVEKLNLQDLTEIFYLDRSQVIEALGSERVTDKLLDEIERAKTASLATVLSSFSIPLIGGTASAKIAGVVNSIDSITYQVCKDAGLGDKATANLMGWLETEYQDLKEFLPFRFENQSSKPVDADAKTICITGKLSSFKTKAEAYTKLISAGYRVVESVTKTLNYLVDEDNKNSSKRKKADEYNVTIVTNLLNFIQGN